MNRRQIPVLLIVVLILLCIAAPDVMYIIGQLLKDMATLIILGK